ncbi:MAG: acyltransferase [Bacteroidota bacterium]
MKIKVLDGFRGYAALMVLLFHLPQISDTVFGRSIFLIIHNFRFNYLGVDLFFVLSGFLITRILLREKKEGSFSFKLFYLKRALRIFPIYYLTLLVCGIFFSWKGLGYIAVYGANYYFAFDAALHPLANTWSLSVEEHYYLFWPLVLYFFQYEQVKRYLFPGVILIAVSSAMLTYVHFDDIIFSRLLYRGSQFRILSLSMGSLLAFNEQKLSMLNKKKVTDYLLFAGLFFCVGAIFINEELMGDAPWVAVVKLFFFPIYSTSLFVLVLLQEKRGNLLDYLFSNGLMRYLGKISYGLYLYHYPILFWWGMTKTQLNDQPIGLVECILPLMTIFLVTLASYHFIERPLLVYKTKLALKRKAKLYKL